MCLSNHWLGCNLIFWMKPGWTCHHWTIFKASHYVRWDYSLNYSKSNTTTNNRKTKQEKQTYCWSWNITHYKESKSYWMPATSKEQEVTAYKPHDVIVVVKKEAIIERLKHHSLAQHHMKQFKILTNIKQVMELCNSKATHKRTAARVC